MLRPLEYDEFLAETAVSRETGDRLRTYLALLEKWQRSINLVGRQTLQDPWRRHFLDSAQLHPLILEHRNRAGDDDVTRSAPSPPVVVDLGSGAGFPGLVLAILGQLRVHLMESDRRKCAFLQEVVRATESDATIHPLRIEQVDPPAILGAALADCVTARACAPLDRLLGLAQPFLSRNGFCLFLKGRTVTEELTVAQKSWKINHALLDSASDAEGKILKITELRRNGA